VFVSFFPQPRGFFISAVGWTLLAILLWYAGGDRLGSWIGLPPLAAGAEPIIGASAFWSPPFLWFCTYYTLAVALFAGFWYAYRPWTTIVELLSVYKRLRTFEAALGNQPLPRIEQEYMAGGQAP